MEAPPYGPLQMERAAFGPGHELAYFRAGDSGEPVLLVMGFCVPGRAWRFQWPVLSERYQVALFDNRGVGQTLAPDGPWSMTELAEDALDLMSHLGWERAHVVGVSMGGMIAQRMALRAPNRLKSLTLIATHAGGLRAMLPSPQGARFFSLANFGASERRGERLARLLFSDAFIAEVGLDWITQILQDDFIDVQSNQARRWQLRAIIGHNTERELAQLRKLPTLIVRPGQDLLVRPEQSDRLAKLLPHATVLSLPNAGHGVIRQCADQVNQALFAHIDRASAG